MSTRKILEKTNWPQRVKEFAEALTDTLIDEGLLEEVPEMKREWLHEALCQPVFDRFVKGDDLFPSEEEFRLAVATATASSVMEVMREEGLVDWIEGEDGEEVIFLTKDGQEVAENVRNLIEKKS
jgi:hypothetical protein